VLPDGQLRVDCGLGLEEVVDLLRGGGMDLVRRAAGRKRAQHEQAALVERVSDLLGLRSLSCGIGVSEGEYVATLSAIRDFVDSEEKGPGLPEKRARLRRSLKGLPVMVGR